MIRLSPPPAPSPLPSAFGGLGRALAGLGTAFVGGLLALFGLLLVIGTLLVGSAALAGWLLWSRWRGAPAPQAVWRRAGAARRRTRAPADGEVIDVPVREVPSRRDGG